MEFLHTASDQKLDGGKDLEKRLLFSYISQSKTTFIKELFMICYWYILSPVNNDVFDAVVHAPMQTKVLEGKLNFFLQLYLQHHRQLSYHSLDTLGVPVFFLFA